MFLEIYLFLFIFTKLQAKIFINDKLCDPRSSAIFPFSGFKIYREYKFHFLNPIPIRYLLLVHCDHGKVDYQTFLPQNGIDISWEKPFCMLKPKLGDLLPLPNNVLQENPTYEKKNISSIASFIRYKFETNLEKLTKNKYFQFSSSRAIQHLSDIQNSALQNAFHWESNNLVCYKMARRKKYAKRKISFYVPETFIGALFECPLSKEEKKKILIMNKNEFHQKMLQPLSHHFSCDSSLARPISPLIAEYGANQWIKKFIRFYETNFIQTIPYLTTASVTNLRFHSTSSSDMADNSWASKILVDENYNFSDIDIHFFTKAMAMTADFLNKKLIINFNNLPNYLGTARVHKSDKYELEQNFEKFNLEQKVEFWLGLIPTFNARKIIVLLQKLWDQMNYD